MNPLRLLLVDDELLARTRLKALLADISEPATNVVASAGNAVEAMSALQHHAIDGVLLDINMPGADGVQLAANIAALLPAPVVVFVTAHRDRALDAFELNAADYLTKPVRLERLQAALRRMCERLANRQSVADDGAAGNVASEVLVIVDRGRTDRVRIADVVLVRAELKYLTVFTSENSYLMEGSLGDLEERFSTAFLRVHRSALVAKAAIRSLERARDGDDGEVWMVRLDGRAEAVAVSRRQLSVVRELLGAAGG